MPHRPHRHQQPRRFGVAGRYWDLVTAVVKGTDLADAPEKIHEALAPYPDARIIALTPKSNWLTSLSGETSLLVAIEYTPAETPSP